MLTIRVTGTSLKKARTIGRVKGSVGALQRPWCGEGGLASRRPGKHELEDRDRIDSERQQI
jgi:hypothetical protein